MGSSHGSLKTSQRAEKEKERDQLIVIPKWVRFSRGKNWFAATSTRCFLPVSPMTEHTTKG